MVVTITEPKIKIVQIGERVTLQCDIQANNQSILSDIEITWVKEDGSPLPNRANLDQNGILIISNVQIHIQENN